MLKEFLKEAVVIIAESGPDSGTNFSRGLRECNLNPIQVRYLAALHPGTPHTSINPRAQQSSPPNESYGSSPNFSYGKSLLKLYSLKLGGWPQTTPNFSVTANPYPNESELTFATFASPEVVVLCLLTPIQRRFPL